MAEAKKASVLENNRNDFESSRKIKLMLGFKTTEKTIRNMIIGENLDKTDMISIKWSDIFKPLTEINMENAESIRTA